MKKYLLIIILMLFSQQKVAGQLSAPPKPDIKLILTKSYCRPDVAKLKVTYDSSFVAQYSSYSFWVQRENYYVRFSSVQKKEVYEDEFLIPFQKLDNLGFLELSVTTNGPSDESYRFGYVILQDSEPSDCDGSVNIEGLKTTYCKNELITAKLTSSDPNVLSNKYNVFLVNKGSRELIGTTSNDSLKVTIPSNSYLEGIRLLLESDGKFVGLSNPLISDSRATQVATRLGEGALCNDNMVTIYAPLLADISWSGPNGFTSTDRVITVNEAGLYKAKISRLDGLCNYESAKEVRKFKQPVANISLQGSQCDDQILLLKTTYNPDAFKSNKYVVLGLKNFAIPYYENQAQNISYTQTVLLSPAVVDEDSVVNYRVENIDGESCVFAHSLKGKSSVLTCEQSLELSGLEDVYCPSAIIKAKLVAKQKDLLDKTYNVYLVSDNSNRLVGKTVRDSVIIDLSSQFFTRNTRIAVGNDSVILSISKPILLDTSPGYIINQSRSSLCGGDNSSVILSTSDKVLSWAGPNNFLSQEEEITVTTPGIYTLSAQDELSGCVKKDTLLINEISRPKVTASVLGNYCESKPNLIQIAHDSNVFNDGPNLYYSIGPTNSYFSKIQANESNSYNQLVVIPENTTANELSLNYKVYGKSGGYPCNFSYPINISNFSCKDSITINGLQDVYCSRGAISAKIDLGDDATDSLKAYAFYFNSKQGEGVPIVDGSVSLSRFANTNANTSAYVLLEKSGEPVALSKSFKLGFAQVRIESEEKAFCTNSTVTLKVNSPTFSAIWSGPNGYTSTEKNISISQPGLYSVFATDSFSGCTSNDNFDVARIEKPKVTASVTEQLCENQSIFLEVNHDSSSINSIDYVFWRVDDGGYGFNRFFRKRDASASYKQLVLEPSEKLLRFPSISYRLYKNNKSYCDYSFPVSQPEIDINFCDDKVNLIGLEDNFCAGSVIKAILSANDSTKLMSTYEAFIYIQGTKVPVGKTTGDSLYIEVDGLPPLAKSGFARIILESEGEQKSFSKDFYIDAGTDNGIIRVWNGTTVCGETPVSLEAYGHEVLWSGPDNFASSEYKVETNRAGIYKVIVRKERSGCVVSDSIIIRQVRKPIVTATVASAMCENKPTAVKIDIAQNDSDDHTAYYSIGSASGRYTDGRFINGEYLLVKPLDLTTNTTLFYDYRTTTGQCNFRYEIDGIAQPSACTSDIKLTGLADTYCSGTTIKARLSIPDSAQAAPPYKVYASYGDTIFLTEITTDSIVINSDTLLKNGHIRLLIEKNDSIIFISKPFIVQDSYNSLRFTRADSPNIPYGKTPGTPLYQCDTLNPLTINVTFINRPFIPQSANSFNWLLNDTLIAGNTSRFVPTRTGFYKATYTEKNCTYETDSVQVIIGEAPPIPTTYTPSACLNSTGLLQIDPGKFPYYYPFEKFGLFRSDSLIAEVSKIDTVFKIQGVGTYTVRSTGLGCQGRSEALVLLTTGPKLPTATLTGDAEIEMGETAYVKLDFTSSPPFSYTLTNDIAGTSDLLTDSIAVSPTETTVYKLLSVSNTCGEGEVSTDAQVTITVKELILGVEKEIDISLNVFPVPAVDEVSISFKLPTAQKCGLSLYSSSGKTLLNKTIGSVQQYNDRIDLSTLPAGTYILKIKAGEKIYGRRIIKK